MEKHEWKLRNFRARGSAFLVCKVTALFTPAASEELIRLTNLRDLTSMKDVSISTHAHAE